MTTTTIPTLTTATFDEELAASDRPVLVDVWAEWCPPCKAVEPVLAAIADEHRDELRLFKINGDEHPEIVRRFDVLALPTLLVFRDGTLVQRIVGAKSKHLLLEDLAELFGA